MSEGEMEKNLLNLNAYLRIHHSVNMSDGKGSKKDGNDKGPTPEKLMDNADILPGFYTCLYNAEKFYKSSKSLFESKDFQSSIPIATISIEESLKGLELLTKFRHNEDITIESWKDLKNHKHKLTHVMQEAIKDLKNSTKEELDKAKKELGKVGERVSTMSVDDAIKNLESRSGIHSHFKELREACFYADWDKLRKKWITFDELSGDMAEALAFFVLAEAQINLNLLKMGIERYVNKLRETGQLLKKLPYPSYAEHRTPDNFESSELKFPIQNKANEIMYDKGLKVMQQFIDQRSFRFLSFGIFRKTMLEYLRVIAKQDSIHWHPHPMIKAIMMALSGLEREEYKEDENIAALSDDSDLTYSGKPMMIFNVVARKKSDIAELVDVAELSHPEFKFDQDVIEKIIRTEVIIERVQGKDVSASIYIEALNVIGVRTKMVKMEEISDAIQFVKDFAQSGKLQGIKKETLEKIQAIKGVEEWDNLDSEIRAMIASIYGSNKYPGFDSYMTPTDTIRKSKCRQMIIMTLLQPFVKTA